MGKFGILNSLWFCWPISGNLITIFFKYCNIIHIPQNSPSYSIHTIHWVLEIILLFFHFLKIWIAFEAVLNRRGMFFHRAEKSHIKVSWLYQQIPQHTRPSELSLAAGYSCRLSTAAPGPRVLPSVARSRPTTYGLAAMAGPTPGWMAKLASTRVSLMSTSSTWACGFCALGCSSPSPTRLLGCRSSLQNVRNNDNRVGMLPSSLKNCSRAWLFFAVRLPRMKTIRTTKSWNEWETTIYNCTAAGTNCWKEHSIYSWFN